MSRAVSGVPLRLEGIAAGYGGAPVLRDLSLDASGGELIALLGPSGCGKTTVLKVVAGLLAPMAGSVWVDGENVNAVAAERRRAAMVFQKPLLFPYLSVEENIGFGLRMQKLAAAEIAARVGEALEMVQLGGFGKRRPRELSGGQEQRVALARALVTNPRVLLLDEPFSALDENLRGDMRALLRGLQQRLGITTLFVTHDQAEAVELAERVGLLLEGRLEQVGAPRDFYTAPATLRAARFFGWLPLPGDGARVFRPESARLGGGGAGADAECLAVPVVVTAATDLGTRVVYAVRARSGECYSIAGAGGGALLAVGAEVPMWVVEAGLRRFGG